MKKKFRVWDLYEKKFYYFDKGYQGHYVLSLDGKFTNLQNGAGGCEEFSPIDVTFDMPGDVTIPQMLWNFECYLKACGFVFDGHLEVVPEESYDVIDEDPAWEGEVVEKFNKNLSKLEAEVKKNKWVHGMCNPPASDWSEARNEPDNCWNS